MLYSKEVIVAGAIVPHWSVNYRGPYTNKSNYSKLIYNLAKKPLPLIFRLDQRSLNFKQHILKGYCSVYILSFKRLFVIAAIIIVLDRKLSVSVYKNE